MKLDLQPEGPHRLFGSKRLSQLPKRNYGSFRVQEKSAWKLRKQNSRAHAKGKKPGKGARPKQYCASQAQNTVPGQDTKKIRVKFNKSTFYKPDKAKGLAQKRRAAQREKGNMLKFQGKKGRRARGEGRTRPNQFAESERNSLVSSEQTSCLKSHKHLELSKSSKRLAELKLQREGSGSCAENCYSVTSTDKAKLVPSVMSLGTDNSVHSNQPKDNEEFNLYCMGKSHRTNNSGSQLDIIYNRRRQAKRGALQTEHTPAVKTPAPSKALLQTALEQSRPKMGGRRKRRRKKRSFQGKQHN